MPNFAYQARNSEGQQVTGTRAAADHRAALEGLRQSGFFVTQLKPLDGAAAPKDEEAPRPPPAASLQPISNALLRASAQEMSLFFRQMHAMLDAGVSVAQALSSMSRNAPAASLRQASAVMSSRTSGGQPWSEAMREYPGLFSELAIGLIAAGETGGFMARMCLRLSEYSERDYHLQQTIKRETWYPKMLLFASIIIPSLPALIVPLYQGKNAGLAVLGWAQNVLPPLVVVGAIWLLWKINSRLSPLAARRGSVRYMMDRTKLMLPVAGKTARSLATAKFCRALAALQSAGTGVHRAVALAANACGNAAIAEGAMQAVPRVQNGESLTSALSATGHFSPIALQMLSVGEESGMMDVQLEKAADFLEGNAETTIKQSVGFLGVAVLLFIGIRIGMQVIGFWTGYFNSIFDAAGGQ